MATDMSSTEISLPDLKDKVVFITGASSGVGQAAAVEFSKQGSKVAIHGRNEERLKETVRQCVAAGTPEKDILYVMGDVTKEEENEAAIAKVLDYFGTVHVLVNNAAASVSGQGVGIDSHTTDDMLWMMKLHVLAPFQFIKLLKPHLIKNKGSIVCVSSDSAHRPDPTMFGYTVGKCGLVGLAKIVALELAPLGVRCNIVSPSWIKTPFLFNSGFMKDQGEAVDYIAENVDLVPLKHIAEPAEIARMILFMSSNCCYYVTGQDIVMDGCNSQTSIITAGLQLKNEKLL